MCTCVTTGWALDWWTGGLDTYIYVYTLIQGESQEEYTYILQDYRVIWTHLLLLIKVLGKSTFLQKIDHHFSALCISGQGQACATIVVLFELLLAKQRQLSNSAKRKGVHQNS